MNQINHLYWRAGFGLSPREWAEKKDWPVEKAVDELFREARRPRMLPLPPAPDFRRPAELSREERQAIQKAARQSVGQANVDWLLRMADPQEPALLERMTLFWHGHFACRSRTGILAIQQLNTLRQHALGDFRSLLLGIARDPAMIRYLNNQQNRKEKPNENFARELMELFTIGRGHYTEQDVKEAARAFTGWSSNLRGEFVFRRFWHDTGTKTFMGKTGRFGGEDIIDIILDRPETADFITRKIYRYFVSTNPDEDRISSLSRSFYQSGYDIGKLMRQTFSSDWFYAEELRGNKIKSPVEFLAGMIRSLELSFDNPMVLVFLERAFGQMLFNPPNVAGWPGGKSWIDNSTLMTRLNLPQAMIGATEFNFRPKADLKDMGPAERKRQLQARANLAPLLELARSQDRETSITRLAQYLLLQKPRVPARLVQQFSRLEKENEFLTLASLRLMSLPEYQLC